ncbi:error-prone DNA polymerase, partial [Azospirillum sp. RWY-5-1]
MIPYAELQVTTNFTFLEGASHPDELALTAAALGMRAIGVTDRNSLAGVVQALLGAEKHGLRLVVGCRLDLTDAASLLAYPTDREAYGRLSRLLTLGKRRAPKGACFLGREDVLEYAGGMLFLLVPPDRRDPAFPNEVREWRARLGKRLYLAASHRYRGDDRRRLAWLAGIAEASRVPLVATNDVLMHSPARRPLADVMTCIRTGRTIDEAGWRLAANAERHLKAPVEMARLFHAYPRAVERTVEIAEACAFSLRELRYEYPDEVTGDGRTAQETLEDLTWAGAAWRYPGGVPETVADTVRRELALIAQNNYAPYFLTVHDIVRFAREREILCQGRGSAANSAVCYCLGITAVDPTKVDLLFERFVSDARKEPPDIDVDFEHERREEVMQYIYGKYGRDRAGLTATVIRYRARGAIREVGKAMGLSADVVGRLAGSIWGWGRDGIDTDRAREHGLDPADPRLALALELARELIGFPRHLSQHVGGFVITRGLLSELCPILNAAMAERTTIEWDKDDIDALGLLKVDVLALGMLTCVRRAFDLIERHHGRAYTLATVPQDEPEVYAMLSRADSLGVFQVESRAQMTMLPRLRPKEFYDLVIEVAIVRPGPIQGDMVHPYLRRREGKEPVDYPSPELERVLRKTLGVPLFQEQAMRIAMVAAGFTAEEADRLRRAMATFRKLGEIHAFRDRFIEGMVGNRYPRDFAERCFKQIEGFGTYGFPESHAASFALLVYVSAWIKRFHPDVFACALLNSQPMGFYAPAQIVRDAREHGVTVRPPDVNHADWDCTLEPLPDSPGLHALRLGFRSVKGFAEEDARDLVEGRASGYRDLHDVWRRSGLGVAALERLARADAFGSLGLDRRAALWGVRALGDDPLPLFRALDGPLRAEPAVRLPDMALGEQVVMDYASLSLSLKAHPMALLRDG